MNKLYKISGPLAIIFSICFILFLIAEGILHFANGSKQWDMILTCGWSFCLILLVPLFTLMLSEKNPYDIQGKLPHETIEVSVKWWNLKKNPGNMPVPVRRSEEYEYWVYTTECQPNHLHCYLKDGVFYAFMDDKPVNNPEAWLALPKYNF